MDYVTTLPSINKGGKNEKIKEKSKQIYRYVFKVNGHLVQIGFTENGITAEDCLTDVLKSLYK